MLKLIFAAIVVFGLFFWWRSGKEAMKPAADSGVAGKVLLGPICPVIKDPPEPDCADKPYQTTVQAVAAGGSENLPFASAETNEDGRYKIMLPPGEYSLRAVGKNPLPSCGARNIIVEPDKILEINLSCDTGIR